MGGWVGLGWGAWRVWDPLLPPGPPSGAELPKGALGAGLGGAGRVFVGTGVGGWEGWQGRWAHGDDRQDGLMGNGEESQEHRVGPGGRVLGADRQALRRRSGRGWSVRRVGRERRPGLGRDSGGGGYTGPFGVHRALSDTPHPAPRSFLGVLNTTSNEGSAAVTGSGALGTDTQRQGGGFPRAAGEG